MNCQSARLIVRSSSRAGTVDVIQISSVQGRERGHILSVRGLQVAHHGYIEGSELVTSSVRRDRAIQRLSPPLFFFWIVTSGVFIRVATARPEIRKEKRRRREEKRSEQRGYRYASKTRRVINHRTRSRDSCSQAEGAVPRKRVYIRRMYMYVAVDPFSCTAFTNSCK
jgi:hypothetical protein